MSSNFINALLLQSGYNAATGPIIVIVCFALFALSLLLAPNRGVLAAVFRHLHFQRRVHMRQGLLALAHQEQIFDPLTIRVLRRAGLIRADSVATAKGKALASKTLRDEKRWEVARQIHQDDVISGRYDGLTPIEAILTRDEISEIDRHLGPPVPATA
ncbi:hypothetical protein JYP46_21225 [Nitratireductor aquimarinus]|uniref:hypothetical protein n=1 Tax=Alphaproteobacteria TaxID=28211 RepID=UPI0019D3F60C|nr:MULTISPECIES: hypothetical protein [Alphaproteobacteria]MBN7759349.1 hypothetical protein [Nitratireductor aquimarinus]MBY6002140.1 hypothetical protein [Tritonibacter mobilis]MBY6024599.1 hypothetical protein [Nitratireductor sp. DP7N14-4]